MKIHAFSAYSAQAGSTRVRLYDWFRHLDMRVHAHTYMGGRDARPKTLVRNAAKIAGAERRLRRVDLIDSTAIVSREVSPLSNGTLEKRVMSAAERSVYDFDDALFADMSPIRRILRQSGKCESVVSAADVVIAGNEYLANWAQDRSANVVMIPSCVDPSSYLEKSDWEIRRSPSLVWVGSPSTERYVADIATELLRVHNETGARLRLVSGPERNPALAALEPMMERIPWSPEAAADALQASDVAIGPLADTPFARGKCAYKLLQYAASGLPIVASPVGANGLALKRFDGLAVEHAHDWSEAVQALLEEPSTRRSARGRSGIEAVRRFYSFEAWEREWRTAIGLPG